MSRWDLFFAVALHQAVVLVEGTIAGLGPALGQAVGTWLGAELCLIGLLRALHNSDAVIGFGHHQRTVVGPQPDGGLGTEAIAQKVHTPTIIHLYREVVKSES